MMVIIGAIIVIGVIYLLLKRHESRMVLIAAGILMAVIAGKPMAALDAFAKSMTNAGLITSVCSCMGFAMVMKYTGCDKHLVVAIGKVLKKMAGYSHDCYSYYFLRCGDYCHRLRFLRCSYSQKQVRRCW